MILKLTNVLLLSLWVAACGTVIPSPTATPLHPTWTPSPIPTATLPPNGSWASGVFIDSWTPTDVEAFGAWRDRPLDVVVLWPARQTWADFTGPSPVYTNFADRPYTMAYGIPLIPEDGSATLADVAAGSYNQNFRDLGTTLVNSGQGQSILRLAWEFNGNWYVWSAYEPGIFIAAFQQAVLSIKTTAPAVKIDWTVNRGTSQSIPSGRAEEAYPGDAYVDIIGIDNYDRWGNWQEQLAGSQGLNYWAGFARAHNKQLSVPEWGLSGDNPSYITHMYDFFNANRDILAYEGYFNCSCAGVIAALWNPVDNPKGSAEYNRLW